jgi:hypothetical protein
MRCRDLSIITLSACTAIAGAGDLVNLSVEVDGWTIMPIAENGATTHIIAARNDDETLTTDIDVVLYEKTATGWSGSAYDPSVTKEDAMIDIANEFGLVDPFGGDWHIDLDTHDVLDHVLPRVPFGKGFFVTDPLHTIANQIDDPEPLAEAAENSGLAAGSGAVNTGSISSGPGGSNVGGPISESCGCDACIQDALSQGSDALISDPALSLAAVDGIIGTHLELFGCCWPRITRCITTNGPWNCSGWVLDGTDPTPAGVSCRYVRNVFRLQSQNCIKVCLDCSSFTFNRSRIQSGTEPGTTVAANPAACTPPPAGGCGAILQNEDFTNWSPAPACP